MGCTALSLAASQASGYQSKPQSPSAGQGLVDALTCDKLGLRSSGVRQSITGGGVSSDPRDTAKHMQVVNVLPGIRPDMR